MPPILEARGLTERFNSTQALAGLDLTAERRQVTAILGPKGTGKTTFIRMVATLLLPDPGSLTVAGVDAVREPARVRRAIGLAGQSAAVEDALSGRESLELVGRLFGHERKQARASRCRARAAGPGRQLRSAGPHLLGRHAPQARPRGQPGGGA